MKKIPVLFFLFSLLCCTLPPFDDDLNQSADIIEDMTKEAEITEIENLNDIDNSYFVPCKGDYEKGFLIADKSDRIEIFFIEECENRASNQYVIARPDQYTNHYLAAPIHIIDPVMGDMDYLAFNRMYFYLDTEPDLYSVYYENYEIINYFTPMHTYDGLYLNLDPGGILPAGFLPQNLIGSCINENISATTVSFLLTFGSSHYYYEELWELDSMGDIKEQYAVNIEFRGLTAGLPFPELPEDLNNVFYFFDLTTVNSFFSFYNYDTGKYDSYKIDIEGNLTKINIPYKIDAIISSGLIYCEDHGKAYLYDFNGIEQYFVNLGDLKFNYEIWDNENTKFKMIFTLPFKTPSDDHDDYNNFYIYSIDTEDFSILR